MSRRVYRSTALLCAAVLISSGAFAAPRRAVPPEREPELLTRVWHFLESFIAVAEDARGSMDPKGGTVSLDPIENGGDARGSMDPDG